jgi:spermidine/putrescine ABC transporter ATP-binding subunit
MAMLTVRGLCKFFGEVKAVNHIDLDVEDGEMLCLLGPSGCGKTTLLMTLSGFITPSEGVITMDGVDVTNLPPEKRPTSLVFQNYALFPHLTVFENVAFGLKAKKVPRSEIQSRVEEMLKIVDLEGKGGRSINQLSGGQQQRVALARALVMKPKVLLLDEPLSNLDAKLRVETRQQIRKIQQSVGITSIFVTHDQEEALTMADRIAVMKNGQIEQFARPQEIYHHPSNSFVADFIGKSNFLRGSFNAARQVYTLISGKELLVDEYSTEGSQTRSEEVLIIRPEYLSACLEGKCPPEVDNCLTAEVKEVTFLGELTQYVVDLGVDGLLRLNTYGYIQQYEIGDKINVYWKKTFGQVLTC